MRWLIPLALLAAGPALAGKDPKPGPGAEPAHGHQDPHATAGGHGAAGDHGGDHGGAHHAYYTDDDDHDGIPNWRDPMQGEEPNGETYVLSNVGYHAFNLLLLVGILGFAVRRPLADTFRERALGIRNELTDSARRRDESHQRHQELVARLEKIEQEVQAMHAEAEVEAAREEAKLVERAEREATRISDQAERAIRDEALRARNTLRREAVELAVKLAEDTLKNQVASADQQALARDFLESLRDGQGVQ